MDRTNLPFQVQTHISEKLNLAWEYNPERLVYIELRRQEELYEVLIDNKSFEICWLNQNVFTPEASFVWEKYICRL